MIKLEDIKPGISVKGILPNSLVRVLSTEWFGTETLKLVYEDPDGNTDSRLLFRSDLSELDIIDASRPWSFNGDGDLFRLVSEAHRIRLAHLFDPVLAVHTSQVDPLPHQITAVYESMLPRQPLRFLLADDPGSGKTIMAGLLMRELIVRGDLNRCIVICPGSLAEQWQDELFQRFQLPFEIMTNDKLESARTGNWFLEYNLVIARLDKLSRDENVQLKLSVPETSWDLVVVDEAHKMSASFTGGEIKYTKRYKLGQLMSRMTRHFLLMTATPHSGIEENFQLFMSLIDSDRFEGKFRDGVHSVDVSDLMRRMVKEKLVKFDGRPLFPERVAKTVPFRLSEDEAKLYKLVTEYVREEFNRAEAVQNDRRRGTVGFALTILQRRLASSPEAIHKSLSRRKERLDSRLKEVELLKRGVAEVPYPSFEVEDWDYLEDLPDEELAAAEDEVLDQATAARTADELRAEIKILGKLERHAKSVLRSGEDTKWVELKQLIEEIFTPSVIKNQIADERQEYQSPQTESFNSSPDQKLVIFTEHKDTLFYLHRRISTLLGSEIPIVIIHGGMGREDRLKAQEAFKVDPEVKILLATDAAGEGINLQRAHLMINYDLPWNPNRLEQRFGRIHRIGQKNVCFLWNLVANETREGDVYQRLLEKLERSREALHGQVYDVLGQLEFEGKSLRQLLIDAIRMGEDPRIKARLDKVIDDAVNPEHLRQLIENESLVNDVLDTEKIRSVRIEMERAESRRLQPYYIESFFLESFRHLGGSAREREKRRYQVTRVPAVVKNRDRLIGIRAPISPRYERITFEKDLINQDGKPPATFVSPGHPLLDSSLDLILERHRDLLRRGTILVDESDFSTQPRVMFYLEHAIQDAQSITDQKHRDISRRMLYVEIDSEGKKSHLHYAPYLDYRPLKTQDPDSNEIMNNKACEWIDKDLENAALQHAIETLVHEHLDEVRGPRLEWIAKTRAAVQERLTREINYWDHRAQDLKYSEKSGKSNPKINAQEAQRRADELAARLQKRMDELDLQEKISAKPPVVLGGLVVVPVGLLQQIQGKPATVPQHIVDTQTSAAKARSIVMETERNLGFDPIDREADKVGYDIESINRQTGRVRFIEVKGRVTGASTITVTKNEILYSLNKPDSYFLVIVEFDGDQHSVHYIREPFTQKPEFGVTSINYSFSELLKQAVKPEDTV